MNEAKKITFQVELEHSDFCALPLCVKDNPNSTPVPINEFWKNVFLCDCF